MQVSFVRMAAPLKPGKKRVRPVHRVLIATDMHGQDWVHFHTFAPHEIEKGRKIMERIDASGQINPQHWSRV